MRYPLKYSFSENEKINRNDIVWFNEGTQVGFIYEIITEPIQWGLEEGDTGVMIQALHPLNAREQEHSPGLMFNSMRQFEDEGLGKLSEKELEELNYAVEEFFRTSENTELYTVSAVVDVDTQVEYWHISSFDDEASSEPVRIRFRTGTRNQFD